MHWIDFYSDCRRGAGLFCVGVFMVLAGCASQDTILPPTDNTMLDIYRGAMHHTQDDPIELPEPTAVCQELALEEPVEDCVSKVAEHRAAFYRAMDAQPAGDALDYLPYTREVATETQNLFPRLENPDLLIYVYPHLATRARAPIPGYTTVIPLYDQVQYRLPGESQRITPVVGDANQSHTGAREDNLGRDTVSDAPNDSTVHRTTPREPRYHKHSDIEGAPLAPPVTATGTIKTMKKAGEGAP